MNDYIKRSDVIDSIKNAEKWWWNADDLREYHKIFESIPAADVEPVRHEKWEVTTLDGLPGHRPISFFCSGCLLLETRRTPFCSCCGAKMDKGGVDDGT